MSLRDKIETDYKTALKLKDKNMTFKLEEKRKIDRNLINTLKNMKISSLIK